MKVVVTRLESIELDGHAVDEVFKKRLDSMCGGEHTYIDPETGKVMDWEDTGHGSGLTEEVKDPSPRMVAALKFRAELTKIRHAEIDAERKQREKEQRRRK